MIKIFFILGLAVIVGFIGIFIYMKFLKNQTILVKLAIFLTPTTMAAFIPISFSTKITAGLFFLLLFSITTIGIFFNKKIFKSKIHFLLLILIFIKIFFFMYAYIHYGYNIDSKNLRYEILGFSVGVISMLTFFIFYQYLVKYKIMLYKSQDILIKGFLFSVVITILMYAVMLTIFQVGGLYELRTLLFQFNSPKGEDDPLAASGLPAQFSFILTFFKTMGGTAEIGPFMSMITLYTYGLAFFSKNNRKIIYYVAFILAFIAIYLTASRSALISTIFVIFIFQLYYVIYFKKKYIYAQLLFFLFFIMIMIVFTLPDEYNVLSTLTSDETAKQPRLKLWANAFDLFIVNPFGYGYDYIRYEKFYGSNYFYDNLHFEHNHLHNTYVAYMIDYGVFALTLLLVILFKTFRTALNNIKYLFHSHNNTFLPLSISLFLAFCGSLVHFMFGKHFLEYDGIYGTSFWLIVSMIYALSYFIKKSPQNTDLF